MRTLNFAILRSMAFVFLSAPPQRQFLTFLIPLQKENAPRKKGKYFAPMENKNSSRPKNENGPEREKNVSFSVFGDPTRQISIKRPFKRLANFTFNVKARFNGFITLALFTKKTLKLTLNSLIHKNYTGFNVQKGFVSLV